MKNSEKKVMEFERVFIGLNAVISGLVMMYLSFSGPLILNRIIYKTPPTGIYQIQGQDLVNLILIAPLLILGGILLLMSKKQYKYFLVLTPLTVIYYALSYTIGCEWSSSVYKGNSEKYAYFFLYILICALLIMLYTLQDFRNQGMVFNKKWLTVYTVVLGLFSLLFAMMWMKEVNQVIFTGTSRSYNEAPTAFWLVRYFDLGFSIPLLLISTYLLWTRASSSLSMQMLSYGFFITMAASVNSMGFMMLVNRDKTASIAQQGFFILLGIVVLTGYLYILRNRRLESKGV